MTAPLPQWRRRRLRHRRRRRDSFPHHPARVPHRVQDKQLAEGDGEQQEDDKLQRRGRGRRERQERGQESHAAAAAAAVRDKWREEVPKARALVVDARGEEGAERAVVGYVQGDADVCEAELEAGEREAAAAVDVFHARREVGGGEVLRACSGRHGLVMWE